MLSVESGLKRMNDQKKGRYKTRLDEVSNPVKVRRGRPARAAAEAAYQEGTNYVASGTEKPRKTRRDRRSRGDETSELEGETSATTEDSKLTRPPDQEDNRSTEEKMSAKERSKSPKIKKERHSGKYQHLSAEEGSDPIEVKKETRTKWEKVVSFSKGDFEPMYVNKERRSETDKLKDESVKPEGVKPKKSRKEGRSTTTEKDEVLRDEPVSAEEGSKPRKPKKERLSRTTKSINPEGESVLFSEDDSKKKKKKKRRSRKKSEDVFLTNKHSANGLSAMVEPWTLLKKVVENHREEVHVFKGIMDLRAAKSGDRAMLQQLETLLKEIDKDRP